MNISIRRRNRFVEKKREKPIDIGSRTALIEPGWKEMGIRNHFVKKIIEFLESYKWSSYQDYKTV